MRENINGLELEPNGGVESMDRRALLLRAGALTALGGAVLASGESAAQSESDASPGANTALVGAALHCARSSEVCIEHCVRSFRGGSLMLAQCAGLVLETIAMCNALAKMGAYNSKHLKAIARVTIGVCKDCEAECRLHESHHAECKACADSCSACIKECEKLLG